MRRAARFLAGFVAALAVAGVLFAANASLPGDMLYGMKTSVNEPAFSFAAFTLPARTNAAVAQAQERLREAASLASTRRLDVTSASTLAKAFMDRSNEAVAGIDKLALEHAEAGAVAASVYASGLNAYAAMFQRLPAETSAPLLAGIAKAQEQLGTVSVRATRALIGGRAGADLQAAAERAMTAAAVAIRDAQDTVDSRLHGAAGDLRLSVAEDALAAANANAKDGKHADAFELALRARAQAHAVIVTSGR